MYKSLYSHCKDQGMLVYRTEDFCENIVGAKELSQNLALLQKDMQGSCKIAIIHYENLRFYQNFDGTFTSLLKNHAERFMVFAEGIDNTFPVKFIPHNEFCMQLQDLNTGLKRIDHNSKTKDFLVLVGRNDINRINLVKSLENLNLLNNSFVSVNAPGDPFHCVYNLEEDHEDLHKDFYTWCQKPFGPHYSKTKLSVVMETNVVEESYQLSEAIYKPLMTEHPFVVLGPVGYLDFLKSYGYETFNEWIDESYDKEQDVGRRISMIANACDKFLKSDVNKFYIESAPVRSRNREIFFNTRSISY